MKNKIYKGIVLALPIICLAVFSACKDPMKDYYDNDNYTGVGTETLLEVLKSNPEYSTFVLILEETGMDKLLESDEVLTVWAPRNADMPTEMAHLDAEQKVIFINNHLSVGAITTNDLDHYSVVSTLSGRNVYVGYGNGVYYVNTGTLIKTNILCKNGVIQQIDTWFVPKPTLYEMLESLPGDYSIFRDSLLGRTIMVLDEENSIPIGTDEDGNPIYEAVYKEQNEIFEKANIADLAGTFTFFVPTNDAMLDMYSEMTNYLNAALHPITSEDTSMWVDWILKASIVEDMWNYRPNSWISNNFWERVTGYIQVGPEATRSYTRYDYDMDLRYNIAYDQTPDEYANGWAYYLNVLRVPKSMYMELVHMTPYSIRKYGVPSGETWGVSDGGVGVGQLDWWTDPVDYTVSGLDDNRQTVRMQFGRLNRRSDGVLPAEYTFKTIIEYTDPDPEAPNDPSKGTKSIIPQDVMPGEYEIAIQLVNNNSMLDMSSRVDSLQLIINGEPITVRRILSGIYGSWNYISNDAYYIPGTLEQAEITVSLFPLDTSNSPSAEAEIQEKPDRYRAWRRFEVGTFRLYPTYNF